jgi:hypothetical protein
MDAGAAEERGPAPDLGAGRHHQLRDARLGRPAHAYDLAKLNGAVVPAGARMGEQVLALNGKDLHARRDEMTVIADDAAFTTLPGSWAASIRAAETTTDVLLEIAYFDPDRIGDTGRKLNLTSDARSPVRARGRSGLPRRWDWPPDRPDPARSAAAAERCGRAGTPPAGPRSSPMIRRWPQAGRGRDP